MAKTDWDSLRQEFRQSALSLRQFAEDKGLNYNTCRRMIKAGDAGKSAVVLAKEVKSKPKASTSTSKRKTKGNPSPKNQFRVGNLYSLKHGGHSIRIMATPEQIAAGMAMQHDDVIALEKIELANMRESLISHHEDLDLAKSLNIPPTEVGDEAVSALQDKIFTLTGKISAKQLRVTNMLSRIETRDRLDRLTAKQCDNFDRKNEKLELEIKALSEDGIQIYSKFGGMISTLQAIKNDLVPLSEIDIPKLDLETDFYSLDEEEQKALFVANCTNRWWRLNNLYRIENEKAELVTFRMRPAQMLLFKLMGFKNIILKARQLGFSTSIDIFILDIALWGENIKCGIIAQDQKASGEIFRTKVEVPLDSLPSWLKDEFPIKSKRAGSTEGKILFENGSSIQVATSFRSGTVQVLHVSEHGKICARYPQKAKEVKSGTLNAVPQEGIVFIESTAEGVGGDYHAMCMNAVDLIKTGQEPSKMDYKFHFYAWFQDPKYATPLPPSGLVLSKAQQEYFAAVEKATGVALSDEQKQWYVNKEHEQGDEMKQEYPSTPLEAFLTSGRRVFNSIKCMVAEGQCTKPRIIYDIDPTTGKKTKAQAMRDQSSDDMKRKLLNMLLVWELPEEESDYAIGVDIAEGLDGNDRSSIDVVRKDTGEQVAHWFGYLDVGLLAHLTKHIGLMYNKAYVGPERNNHGHAFILEFKKIYPVSRIYQEQYIDRDDDDETARLGWLTTAQSKPILIEGLKDLIRNEVSGIRWVGTVGEMNTFVYDSKGRMGAQTGCYDDQVMSYAIAQEMRVRMPKTIKAKPLNRKPNQHWMGH
ncbi:hypothetical protein [Photobacterium damselae]|uniref:hypothetical protein n=1 Tax=Photobacterium damselae TaxID=38293 RepID=UPI0039C3661F